MRTFIRNIKRHWRLALVCAAMLLIAFAVTVRLLRQPKKTEPQSERQGFFLDTDYPVYITQQGHDLLLELDGSKTSDLNWSVSFSDASIASADNRAEKGGKRTVMLSPAAVGFTTVSFTRTGEIAGFRYDAVQIDAEVYVSGDTDADRTVYLSNMRIFSSGAGALDTAAPYLLIENKVILPKGGDWTLTAPVDESVENDAEKRYQIVPDPENEEAPCIIVFRNMNAPEPVNGDTSEQDVLLLESASLGIRQRVECYMNAERNWYLRNAEG